MDLNQEQAIIEQAKLDSKYFGILFDTYYPAIFGYILKRVADPAAAQDITAETFFKALTNLQKFRWQGKSISNWFYKIATNELRMYFRKNNYHPGSLDALFEQTGFEPIDDYNLVEELTAIQTHLEHEKEYARAQKLLLTLPVKYQEVISLRFAEGKKFSEIALILGKKEGTVKSLLSRGLRRLRKSMDQSVVQPFNNHCIVVSARSQPTPKELYEE